MMKKDIRKTSNFSSLPVLIFVLCQQIFVAVATAVLRWIQYTSHIQVSIELTTLILYILVYPIGGSLAALVFYKTRAQETGLKLRQVFRKPQMSAGWIIKWFVITWGLSLLTSFITSLLNSFAHAVLHIQIPSPQFQMGDGFGAFAVSFIALSIFAPLFEEILFRSAVYRNTEIMGQTFAIIFSSLMFALMHGNLIQLPYTMVMGMGFALLFAKTRSIFVPMLLHFIVNTTSVTVTTLLSHQANNPQLLMDQIRNGNLTFVLTLVIYSLIVLGMIIAAIVMGIMELVRAVKSRKKLMGSIFPVSCAQKVLTFYTAPVTLITIALMLLNFLSGFLQLTVS